MGLLATVILTFAQLAPDGCPHEQALQANEPVVQLVYQSDRCVPGGQVAFPAAITQRGALLAAAGKQTEPAAHPPPRWDVEQNRAVLVQVGVPIVGVPLAVQPAYIGVIVPTPMPKAAPLMCQAGTWQEKPDEKVPTIVCVEGSTMHSW